MRAWVNVSKRVGLLADRVVGQRQLLRQLHCRREHRFRLGAQLLPGLLVARYLRFAEPLTELDRVGRGGSPNPAAVSSAMVSNWWAMPEARSNSCSRCDVVRRVVGLACPLAKQVADQRDRCERAVTGSPISQAANPWSANRQSRAAIMSIPSNSHA